MHNLINILGEENVILKIHPVLTQIDLKSSLCEQKGIEILETTVCIDHAHMVVMIPQKPQN